MTNMDQPVVFSERLKQIVALSSTVLAAVLYTGVLGSAIVRTLVEPVAPVFSPTLVRAAGLLSGLVGAIVTAGFARSKPAQPVHLTASHAMGGLALTAWNSIKPPSLLKRNLLGLAEMLGMSLRPSLGVPKASPGDPVAEPEQLASATWLAALYLIVYIVIGVGSFGVSVIRPMTPDLIAQAGWVWLGTTVSSTYTFFGLNSQ